MPTYKVHSSVDPRRRKTWYLSQIANKRSWLLPQKNTILYLVSFLLIGISFLPFIDWIKVVLIAVGLMTFLLSTFLAWVNEEKFWGRKKKTIEIPTIGLNGSNLTNDTYFAAVDSYFKEREILGDAFNNTQFYYDQFSNMNAEIKKIQELEKENKRKTVPQAPDFAEQLRIHRETLQNMLE